MLFSSGTHLSIVPTPIEGPTGSIVVPRFHWRPRASRFRAAAVARRRRRRASTTPARAHAVFIARRGSARSAAFSPRIRRRLHRVVARMRERHRHVGLDAPGPRGHHDDAVGHEDGLVDVVGDEQHRLALALPDASSSSCISARVWLSSAPNGSSISRICGSLASARASAVRCCMPPESIFG